MASAAERMAATRARRRQNLVQVVATIPTSDLDAIAKTGYPDVKADDLHRRAEALGLFISDTVACMDTEDRVPKVV